MGRVVTGVMDDRPFEVQGKKAKKHQHREGPMAHEPAPDGEGSQGIPPKEQSHSRVEGGRWFAQVARNGAQIR